MKREIKIRTATIRSILVIGTISSLMFSCASAPLKPLAHDYTLESFKEAAAWPKQDPVLLLTMTQLFYATGRAEQGVAYFHSLAERDPNRPLLKACEGALMAKMAFEVPVLKRISWVKAALKKLDEAAEDGSIETLYLKALVESELPGFLFGRAESAIKNFLMFAFLASTSSDKPKRSSMSLSVPHPIARNKVVIGNFFLRSM